MYLADKGFVIKIYKEFLPINNWTIVLKKKIHQGNTQIAHKHIKRCSELSSEKLKKKTSHDETSLHSHENSKN